MGENSNNNTQSIADYLAQLLKDKKQLAAFPNVFIHLERLLDEGEFGPLHRPWSRGVRPALGLGDEYGSSVALRAYSFSSPAAPRRSRRVKIPGSRVEIVRLGV